MLKEFDTGQAVVIDKSYGDDKVIRQLIKPTSKLFLQFVIRSATKKGAMKQAKLMGIPQNRVEKHIGRFQNIWVIRWDYRYDYYIAHWEV